MWAQSVLEGVCEMSPYLRKCDLSPHKAGTGAIWAPPVWEASFRKPLEDTKKQQHVYSDDFITAACRGQTLFLSTNSD